MVVGVIMKLVWERLSDSYGRDYQMVVGGVWNSSGRTRGVLKNAVGGGYQMLDRCVNRCLGNISKWL